MLLWQRHVVLGWDQRLLHDSAFINQPFLTIFLKLQISLFFCLKLDFHCFQIWVSVSFKSLASEFSCNNYYYTCNSKELHPDEAKPAHKCVLKFIWWLFLGYYGLKMVSAAREQSTVYVKSKTWLMNYLTRELSQLLCYPLE